MEPTDEAVLHLACPVDVRVGAALHNSCGLWMWRNEAVGHDLEEVAGTVNSAGGAGPWLDPAAGIANWLKTARSGTRTIGFGSELLGGPVIAGRVGPEGIQAAWDAWVGGIRSLPAVVGERRRWLIDGNDALWTVTGTAGGA